MTLSFPRKDCPDCKGENDECCICGGSTNEVIERAEAALLGMPESEFVPFECPLEHRFTPGIYCRVITMPEAREAIPDAPDGSYMAIMGHEHLTHHENVVLSGEAIVSIDGEMRRIQAGDYFDSEPGVRKVLVILRTMKYMTIHPNPTNERDIEKLEAMFVRKSASYLHHHEDLARLLELQNSHS